MGIVLDLFAIAFLFISALAAYKNGFVKTFFGFVSVILAILLACCFSKTLSEYIKESTEMDEWIIESVTNIANNKTELEKEYTILSGENISGEILVEKEESNEVVPSLGGEFIQFVETLPDTVGNIVDLEDVKNQTISNISIKIADVVINIFAWIIIYFAVRIIVAVVTVIFDGIMSIPILKSINNLTGLVIGLIVGVFRIYLVLAIIYFISNVTNAMFFVNFIQTSSLINAMYNNNLIINLIF